MDKRSTGFCKRPHLKHDEQRICAPERMDSQPNTGRQVVLLVDFYPQGSFSRAIPRLRLQQAFRNECHFSVSPIQTPLEGAALLPTKFVALLAERNLRTTTSSTCLVEIQRLQVRLSNVKDSFDALSLVRSSTCVKNCDQAQTPMLIVESHDILRRLRVTCKILEALDYSLSLLIKRDLMSYAL